MANAFSLNVHTIIFMAYASPFFSFSSVHKKDRLTAILTPLQCWNLGQDFDMSQLSLYHKIKNQKFS